MRFPTEVAKYSMLQALYGLPSVKKIQSGMIDNLLDSGALELRYSDLNWAVDRLARLAEEGMSWTQSPTFQKTRVVDSALGSRPMRGLYGPPNA